MSKKLVILGAGGFAREIAWLVWDINQVSNEWEIVGFAEHTTEHVGQVVNGIPIISMEEATRYLPNICAVAAIGDPLLKERAVKEADNFGFKFVRLIHPSVSKSKSVNIGIGSMICAGNILTVNVAIGEHVILNLDCTVGHDSMIEDYVTISPGCHLSGGSRIRRGAFLGTGVVTIENHEIGAYSKIGAGAVVINDIPEKATAVGIPAKPKPA
jgi:sugar O-acyltransferase (sialic acid O-acetyltransferase NeuD family)